MVLFHRAVGVTGGEMAVVQHPHLHAQALAFVQQDAQVPEPAGAVEILMGPGFGTQSADAAVMHAPDFGPQDGFLLSVQPEKGRDGVGGLAFCDPIQDLHRSDSSLKKRRPAPANPAAGQRL